MNNESTGAVILPEPASHSYLGESHHELTTKSVLQAGEVYEILIYAIHGVVCFPGETIPLRIQNPDFIRKLRMQLNQARLNSTSSSRIESRTTTHIGLVRDLQSSRHSSHGSISRVGTTLEIKATHLPNNNLQSQDTVNELVVTGKGRYRFKIVSITMIGNVPSAKVEILDDTPPIMYPYSHHIPYPITSHPSWIYHLHTPERLARIAYELFASSTNMWLVGDESNRLLRWGPTASCAATGNKNAYSIYHTNPIQYPIVYEAERDPIGFSFFLSKNMAVDSNLLQELLKASTVVDRLLLAIRFLQEGLTKRIACSRCSLPIAEKSAIFNLPGAEGFAGAYVNRHGAVHQTITLRSLLLTTNQAAGNNSSSISSSSSNVRYQGRPCLEDSWFPGYAWTIMHCVRCYHHLGWRYDWREGGDGGNGRAAAASANGAVGSSSNAMVAYPETEDEDEDEEGEGEENDEDEDDEEEDEDDDSYDRDAYEDDDEDEEVDEDGIDEAMVDEVDGEEEEDEEEEDEEIDDDGLDEIDVPMEDEQEEEDSNLLQDGVAEEKEQATEEDDGMIRNAENTHSTATSSSSIAQAAVTASSTAAGQVATAAAGNRAATSSSSSSRLLTAFMRHFSSVVQSSTSATTAELPSTGQQPEMIVDSQGNERILRFWGLTRSAIKEV